MSVIEELIRIEDNGTLSFGNYLLENKKKVLDFEDEGDLYKVKTFYEITRLEKNGKLLMETVPGATVHELSMDDKKVTFLIEAAEDLQITMELEAGKTYMLTVGDEQIGDIKANLAGKISFGLELAADSPVKVRIEKAE